MTSQFELSDDTPVYVISVAAQLSGLHPQTLRAYDRLGLVSPGRAAGGGRRYSLRDILILREVQRLSQEEGVNLSGIKRILELETSERRSRLLLAEMHAEIAQLRAELESTRAVAARLAALLRSRTDGGALVPVRPTSGPTAGRRPGRARPSPAAQPRPASRHAADLARPRRQRMPGTRLDGRRSNVDDKLTRKSQEALSEAVQRAAAAGNPNVDGLHLLAALIEQEGGTAAPLLRAVGADPAAVLSTSQRAAGQAAQRGRRHRQRAGDLAAAAGRDRHRRQAGQGDVRRVRLDRAPAGRPGRRRRPGGHAAARGRGRARRSCWTRSSRSAGTPG